MISKRTGLPRLKNKKHTLARVLYSDTLNNLPRVMNRHLKIRNNMLLKAMAKKMEEDSKNNK